MENYINIDKNMIVETTIGDAEVVWRDVREEPFQLHGFHDPKNTPYFCRVPSEIAAALKGLDLDALTLEEIVRQALRKMVK